MTELIRDTAFGHLLRLITRGRVLQYAEDIDPSLWKQYMSDEKTRRIAHHGHAEPDESSPGSEDSSRSHAGGNQPINEPTGEPVDPEKGRDINVVDWFDENDPEVC